MLKVHNNSIYYLLKDNLNFTGKVFFLHWQVEVQKAPPKSLQGEQRRRSQVSVSRAVALSFYPTRGLLYAFGSSITTLCCCLL